MGWDQYYNPKDSLDGFDGQQAADAARAAYDRTTRLISLLPSSATKGVNPLDLQTSLEDALDEVLQAQAAYQMRRGQGKVFECLSALSNRIQYYSPIMDALAQHHPEYVALAWGTVKLVVVAFLNHEERLITFAKVLSRIAEELPQYSLIKQLYPTPQIHRGINFLYSRIMAFLSQALTWMQQGSLRHLLHAVTKPVSVQYKELFDEIGECSRQVHQWAVAASQTELRDVHLMQSDVLSIVQRIDQKQHDIAKHNASQLDEIRRMISTITPNAAVQMHSKNALQTAALINQDGFADKLQITQMVRRAAGLAILDSKSILRREVLLCNRQMALHPTNHNAQSFWRSPKLQGWASMPLPAILRVRASFTSRFQAKELGLGLIKILQREKRPVLWVLPTQGAPAQSFFHILLLQAIFVSPASQNYSTCVRMFNRLTSPASPEAWLDVLAEVLSSLPVVYIIIDLKAMPDRSTIPQWPSQLAELCAKLRPGTSVKVFFMTYNKSDFAALADIFAGLAVDAAISPKDTPPRTKRKGRAQCLTSMPGAASVYSNKAIRTRIT